MAYCDRCERYFNTVNALWQHEANSSRHNICQECDKDFANEWGLIQHFVQSRRHHYCQKCGSHFDDEDDLISHYEGDHHYCQSCSQIFDTELGLQEHNRQKHWYCISCKRLFQSESNLNAHLRSSIHQPKAFKCPGARCGQSFVSHAALILHCEAGTCPSGLTRDHVNRLAISVDRNNVITNPSRLLRGPDNSYTPTVTQYYASENSWNGYAYECVLCHRDFRLLNGLNAHLNSPAHQDKIYRCPVAWGGCRAEFRTLSGLCQHVESGRCGVKRFQSEMQSVMGSLTDGMKRLTF